MKTKARNFKIRQHINDIWKQSERYRSQEIEKEQKYWDVIDDGMKSLTPGEKLVRN